MFEDILIKGAAEMNVPLTAETAGKLRRYWDAVAEKNRVMNLTAITAEDEAARLHFLDSLALLSVCDVRGGVIDVGTGAGFPGAPMAALRPEIKMTLLDATEKKVAFLKEACAAAGIEAQCVHARAEEAGRAPEFREKYDFAVSRAVARLSALTELCLPLVKIGGEFVAMKSGDSEEEIAEAAAAAEILGGAKPEIRRYAIPGTDITRLAVIIRKVAPTAEKYPRPWAKIKKAPL